MAKTIDGNKAGSNYTSDLQTIISNLDGHDAGATPPAAPVLGQIWFNTSESLVEIFNGTAFVPLPIELAGANQGAISGGAGIANQDLGIFANGIVDDNLDAVAGTDVTLASALAIKTYVDQQDGIVGTAAGSALTSHDVGTTHGIQTGTGNGTSVLVGTDNEQTLTRKTLTSPTITSPTITGPVALDPNSHTLVVGDSSDTVSIPGNLVITGTTTTASNLSTSDHDIFIDTGAGSDSAITTGAGILLGNEGTYSGTRHGVTYTSGTGSRWTMSDDLRINGKIDVNGVNVVTALGAWNGLTVEVAKGGTGVTSVATDALLRGAGTTTDPLVATTIGDGLKLTSNSLDVDPTEIKVDEFNGIDNINSATAGAVVIVQTVDASNNKLGYSTSTVDITQVETWARVATGAGNSASADQVLVHTGTTGTSGYAWADLSELTTAAPTGSLELTGNLSVDGVTTIGSSAGDTVEFKAAIKSGSTINPVNDNTVSLGKATKTFKDIQTTKLTLGTSAITGVIKSTDTFSDTETDIPTTAAIRDYVGSTEAGGSIVITTTDKLIPVGTIAIVTLGGVTKLWTASSGIDAVRTVKLSDFLDTGTEFKETLTGFTELKTGGGIATVTIDSNIVVAGPDTSKPARDTGNVPLSVTPESKAQLSVFIDGVYQVKSVYSLSGSTLAFGVDSLPIGSVVEVIIGGSVNFDGGTLTDVTASGTIQANEFVGGGTGITGVASDSHTHPLAMTITGGTCSNTSFTRKAACEDPLQGNGTWTQRALQVTAGGQTMSIDVATLLGDIDEIGE